MPDLKNPKVAIPIVLFAGILWSFGPYVVRHIDQPQTVPCPNEERLTCCNLARYLGLQTARDRGLATARM